MGRSRRSRGVLWAAAVLACGAAVAIGRAAANGSDVAQQPACTGARWTPVASGSPGHHVPADGTYYALSHAGGSWRLAMRGPRGSKLAGRIALNRAVRVTGGRGWARRHERSIGFHVDGSGHTRRLI